MNSEELMTQALELPPAVLAAVVRDCLAVLQRQAEGWTPTMPVFRYVVVSSNASRTPLATATDSATAEQLQRAMGMTTRSTIVPVEQYLSEGAAR